MNYFLLKWIYYILQILMNYKGEKMIEQDTIKLMRECDAGIKMGISSIEDVLEYVNDEELKDLLKNSKTEHERLKEDVEKLLIECGDDGKEPNPVAKGMAWMKTNVKLVMNESDTTIADLITDGCDMGVKSLNKYLNQYKAASEEVKDLAKKIIKTEECLEKGMQKFL